VPRRPSASSFSSTTVTSQLSAARPFATADPVRPQPMTTAFTAGHTTAQDPRRLHAPGVARASLAKERTERGQYMWYGPVTSAKHPVASGVRRAKPGSARREPAGQARQDSKTPSG